MASRRLRGRRNSWSGIRFLHRGVDACPAFAASPAIHTDPLSAKQFEEEYRGAVAAARAGSPQIVRADETQVNTELEAFMRAYRSRSQQGDGSV